MKKYVVCVVRSGFTDQIRDLITALTIREKYNKIIKLDISWFEKFGTDYLGLEERKLEVLNIFDDLNFEIASEEEIEAAKESLFIDCMHGENVDELLEQKPIVYISEKVPHFYKFKKEIDIASILNIDKYFYKFLTSHHKNILTDINTYESIALHIRRGDYPYAMKLGNMNNDATIEYIIKSINYFYNNFTNIKIFIFSNNNEYIDNNIIPLMKLYKFNYEVIRNNREYVDFYLISKCKHTISTLGKFAEIAFIFNYYNNKIFINTNNIDNILANDYKNKKEKYYQYICQKHLGPVTGIIFDGIKPNISSYSMINIFNLISRNDIKYICQIGILDAFETHSLLKYSVSSKRFMLYCFENNERDISGIEVINFTKEEKELFKLYNDSTPIDCENILNNNILMDIILFTKEISHPLALIYLIYLYNYMNNEIIIIMTNLSHNEYGSFNNFIFNISNCEKEIFYNYEENKYDNVGYIKINKNELLNIIKLASNNKFNNHNILFYDKIIDMTEDYFNYINIEKAYNIIERLKKYMDNKFDTQYINYIINNLYKNFDLYINNFDLYHNKINEKNELLKVSKSLFLISKEIDTIKNNIYNTENYSKAINKKIDILINFIAWWIPFKKLRDNFRKKFIEH